ncbi:MAG: tRNA-specific 2-thiouridylase MnmA [Patescibacteria group bacterium]|nr:tRNA-specific 2-thiouridylase MnmA [Patescibacteria group bacterium]
MEQAKQTVYVGMSGGVDSSLSAAILKEAGYNVIGVFIRAWEAPGVPCTWKDDRRDAMRVAAQLSIPFKTLDLSKEYKEEVVDYLISEYKAGRTPNPDVMCNKEIKFGKFFQWARSEGADFVATGHYAQIKKDDEDFKMIMGYDQNKDQTYFLWTLKKEQLGHILFPIGHLEKQDVRLEAEKRNLFTATKKDSQGVCFLGKLDMAEFLQNYLEVKKGVVVNENGEEIGVHDGVYFYTLGQRHGFSITQKTDHDSPYYIVGKDVEKNILIVSTAKEEGDLESEVIKLIDCNWNSDLPNSNKKYSCRYRYRGELLPCLIKKNSDTWLVEITEAKNDIASGQSLVIYDGDICLGGGVIQ